MVNLTSYYNKKIYNTEGKYIGKVNQVILNIRKGRISFFRAKALTEDTDDKNVGLKEVLRNSMRIPYDEEDEHTTKKEEILDVPYEIVTAVGDIILIDQNRLKQIPSYTQNKIPVQKTSPELNVPQN